MGDCVSHMDNINKKDNWQTPKDLYDKLDAKYHFTFDPCPVNPKFDGLKIDWHGSVFCNPPYSEVAQWVEKAHQEIDKGNVKKVVFLIYAKTDTRWFHKYIWKNPIYKWQIDFLKGRVKFVNPNGNSKFSAPYPSMLLIWEA